MGSEAPCFYILQIKRTLVPQRRAAEKSGIKISKVKIPAQLSSQSSSLENPHKLPIGVPQFLTFKLPKNLIFCFCASSEAPSLERTDGKYLVLPQVHTDSSLIEGAQSDQALSETIYNMPKSCIWQKYRGGYCFLWKCAQNGLISEHSFSYRRHSSLVQLFQAHQVPPTPERMTEVLCIILPLALRYDLNPIFR